MTKPLTKHTEETGKTLKQRVREALTKLSYSAKGHDKYGNNGYVILSGKKYALGKMSYDEWYVEPWRRGKTERDTFHKDTLWEKSDLYEMLELLEANEIKL